MHAGNPSYWTPGSVYAELDVMELLGLCYTLSRSHARLRTIVGNPAARVEGINDLYLDTLNMQTDAFMALAAKMAVLGCKGNFFMGLSTRGEWKRDREGPAPC